MGPALVRKETDVDPLGGGRIRYLLECPHGTAELWATGERVALLGDGNVVHELADDHKALHECVCSDMTKLYWAKLPTVGAQSIEVVDVVP